MSGDIVAALLEEARFVDVAENVGDEISAEYAHMCLAAADTIQTLRAEKETLAEFIRDLIRETSWCGDDLAGSDLAEKAESKGLLKTVPFDPTVHDGLEAWHMSPGDDWTIFAGPLAKADASEAA